MHPIQSLRFRAGQLDRPWSARWRKSTVKANLQLPDLPPTAGVWAITVVRDEADVIGLAVDHLIDQGVSRVLAVDHLSRDETPQLIAARGEVVTVVPYRHPGFAQGTIMTALAQHAPRHGAQWIVPFDADEIWWTSDGAPLAEHLLARSDDAAQAERWNYLPTATDGTDENPLRRLTHRREKPARRSKVAFRSHPRITVAEGNHRVRPERTIGSGLVIAHYPYRSRDQWVRKILQGSAGVADARLPRSVSRHWRGMGMLDASQLGRIWDDFVVTHRLSSPQPDVPEALVYDPEARALRGVSRSPRA